MKDNKTELIKTKNYNNLKDAYVPYPLKFAKRNGLNVTQTLIYSIIKQFSKFEHSAYTGSLQTLQVMLNISKKSLRDNFKSLIERKLILRIKLKSGRVGYVASAQPEETKKALRYVAYPLRFAVRFNLTRAQTVLYAIIAHYSRLKKKAYTGSIATLAEALNLCENSIRDNLTVLIKRGFIIKYVDESARVTYVDGLTHTPGQTEKEIEFNVLWVENNGLIRPKAGRSRRKGLSNIATIIPESRNSFGKRIPKEKPKSAWDMLTIEELEVIKHYK